MTFEVSINGSPPWGFRISGGPEAEQPTFISRVSFTDKDESESV